MTMVALLSVLGGVILGSFLQVRALGSQDIWADMRRIFNDPNPLNANPTNHAGNPIQGDAFHRLTKYPNKTEVNCPKQTERTLVLLISGQSNSANHGGQRYASQYGDKVLNYFDGKCYIAQSPLLGSTGLEGDSWTLLGNLLIQQGKAERVIIAPTGIAGSAISQWKVGSPYQQMLQSSTQKLLAQYRVTHMLWHQGETDYGKRTSQEDYEKLFTGIADALRQQGMDAPIYVSQASQCWMDMYWRANNPVVMAQRALANPEKNIRAGVNSDALMGALDRYDNCHFSGSGQEKFARAWLELLTK
ncbi:MAG: putative secreted protein [Burkholderiaceae bacterium]|nr:putative secreted protein [Burkholderiaceae bacterium]